MVYLARSLDNSALTTDHAWEKTHAKENKRRRKHLIYRIDQATRFRLRFGNQADKKWVRQAIASPGNVLDVGCGSSCRIAPGIVPFGIEISEGLARLAEPKYRAAGGRIVVAPAEQGLDQFEDGFFTAAVLRSYLEHELKPREVLAQLHRKLKPGGIALVKVPDFDSIGRLVMGAKWCGFRYPDHLNYFSETTLTQLAHANGFRLERQNLLPRLNDNLYTRLVRI
jgi:SAM-dependent methyltransferase